MDARAVLEAVLAGLTANVKEAYDVTLPSKLDTVDIEGDGETLAGHFRLNTPHGPVSVEVHDAEQGGGVWLCLPRPAPSHSHAWYRFDTSPPFRPLAHPKLLSTPYPWWEHPDPLTDTGAWAGYDVYYSEAVFRGNDPPHWSAIVTVKDLIGLPKEVEATTINHNLHEWLWHPETRSLGVASLNAIRFAAGMQDLTDRAMVLWSPFTARGIADEAGFPDGDLGVDHAEWYHHNGEVSTGPLAEVKDHDWPGTDWDVQLVLEPDVAYMGSQLRPDRLRVEIEHFALPEPYRPKVGDWVQVTGRWIIDAGHGHYLVPPESWPLTVDAWLALEYEAQEPIVIKAVVDGKGEKAAKSLSFYTEIHPPELVVSCKPPQGLKTHARVIATGAWLGTDLTFVVFPPPRPSAGARLQFNKVVNRDDNCTLTVKGWPPGNPNHVFGRIQRHNPDPVYRYNSGLVAMTQDSGLEAHVSCWWETDASLEGHIVGGEDGIAKGARLFYHDANLELAQWNEIPVAADGTFFVEKIEPATYTFRPCGSGWDFPASACPDTVKLDTGENNLVYTALPRKYPGATAAAPISLRPGIFASFGFGRRIVQTAQLERVALQHLGDQLFTMTMPPGTFGVTGNSMGYPDELTFALNLASIVDAAGNPVTDLASVVKPPGFTDTGAAWYPNIQTVDGLGNFISASRGPGVANALLHVQLLLGNNLVGRHIVDELELRTDAQGSVIFRLDIGNRCEDFAVHVRVLENPANTWFKPQCTSRSYFALPGAHTTDQAPLVPYRLVPPLANAEQTLAAAKALARALAKKQRQTQRDARVLDAARRRQPGPVTKRTERVFTDTQLAPLRRLLGR